MNTSVAVESVSPVKHHSLFDLYQGVEQMYFASPHYTLLAQPPFASLLKSGLNSLATQVQESLRFAKELGFNQSLVVGAIPFDEREPAQLRVCTQPLFAQGRDPVVAASADQLPEVEALQEYPAQLQFEQGVTDALARFARGELDKVVLARTLTVRCKKQAPVRALVRNLVAKNPNSYTFAMDLSCADSVAPRAAFIGASPELLIAKQGNKVTAHPLAGSEPRLADEALDQANAERLLKSEKDLYEHALVVKAIHEALKPYCKNLTVPGGPSLVATPTLWHLGTFIEGELINPSTSSLELAQALHPTPAVGGYPTQNAQQAIAEIEPFARGLFTGMVGWCDGEGNGEWAVTIRCAKVQGQDITLYAGAGIVPGSSPNKEYRETGAKFNTMLNALGVAAP